MMDGWQNRMLTHTSVNSYDSICCDISLQTGFAVVFPEFTLAPEAEFPTQQEQCYAVVKWVHEHGFSKGLLQDRFAVVGDSSGGLTCICCYLYDVSWLTHSRPSHHRHHNPLLHPPALDSHRAPDAASPHS
jgi:hypothetical protein